MRKFLVVTLFAVAFLGMLAPPVFAQAPTPKVTITGTFDQVTSGGYNFYDGNYSRNGDREWYARTRFRPDFEFAVGRTKAVLGVELDLSYGQSGQNDGGFPGNTTGASTAHRSANGALDVNTDVGGMIEIKWIYTEFDLTGKDSLMPFIPVPTVARAGGQPFATLGNYKIAYANGDFAGVSAVTTFAPNLKTNLAYVIVEDENAAANRGAIGAPVAATAVAAAVGKPTRGKDYAIILSPEITPMKGLDIKPLYSYFRADGLTNANTRRAAADRFVAGGTTAAAGTWAGSSYIAGDPSLHENRHTLGVDARWRSGPFGLDPTVYYQVGDRHVQAFIPNTAAGTAFTVGQQKTTMSAWLFDAIGSYQVGPFLLEARGIYSTGNDARDNLSRRISYYEPLDLDSSYYAGWASILALGIDYFNGGGTDNNGMAGNVGYDRYGRAQFGIRGTYNMTPAFAVYGVVNPTWTAKKVDTHTGQGAGAAVQNRTIIDDKSFAGANASEQSRYIGTEADLGFTWKFAPNTAFDLAGAWLFAGKALDTFECQAGTVVGTVGPCGAGANLVNKQAQDAWTIASRIRLSF
jgi:hypothetical protein